MKYGGIFGPLAFFISVLVVGNLREDYSHAQQLISELGEASGAYSLLFNYGGFFVTGATILAFATFLRAELKQRSLSVAPAVLIAIHGIGMFLATWASCDIGCPAEGSSSQLLHNVIAGIKFPALLIATAVLGVQLIRIDLSKLLGAASLLVFVLSLALMVKFTIAAEAREYAGYWQRAFLSVIYLWLVSITIYFVGIEQAKTAR